MVGVIAQPFVTPASFPFVLLLAMMISFPSNQISAFWVAIVVELSDIQPGLR
jgi:hypothetical protein